MEVEEVKKKLVGIQAVMPTPFKSDFSLDPEGLRKNTKFLVDNGIRTGVGFLSPTGSIGEFSSMKVEEIKEVIKTVVDAANGEVPVVPGTSSTYTETAIELAKFAESVGALAVMVTPPFYGVLSPTEEEMYTHWKMVNDAINIGLVIYNLGVYGPAYTHLDVTEGLMHKLVKLKNVVGIKYAPANMNMWTYVRMLEKFADKISFIDNAGPATSIDLGFKLGARSYVSSISNFLPKHELEVWETTKKNDYDTLRKKLEEFTLPWYRFLGKYPGLGNKGLIKVAMDLFGLAGGYMRPPFNQIPQEIREEAKELFVRLGVLR